MGEQRYIRFRIGMLDDEMLADVVKDTDAMAPETIRVVGGIAVVGFRGPEPLCVEQLRGLGALVEGPSGASWTYEEVRTALPRPPADLI